MKTRVFAKRSLSGARVSPTPRAAIRRAPENAGVRQIVRAPGTASAAPQVEPYLGSLDGRGQALAPSLRADMEPRFGADFANVRMHTGPQAAGSAAALGARAYTFDRHVVFGAGEYSPETAAGRRLVAHELAHVLQQRGSAGQNVQRQVDPNYVVDDPYAGSRKTGAPERVFFGRDSDKVPAGQNAKIDAFKSGKDQSTSLTLLGLATEDELAAKPGLPGERAKAVDAALGTALAVAPKTRHDGARAVTAGAAARTKNRPDLRFNRAVELLRPGEASWNPDTAPGLAQACKDPTEKAFQKAKQKAFDWIDAVRVEVKKRPVAGMIAMDMAKFFGNHDASTARRLDHNLGLIRDELERLAKAANHRCAEPNDTACFGAIAFNALGEMTVCSGFESHSPEEQASVLVHEASHSTAGLRITGKKNMSDTRDLAYRHERLVNLLGQINPDDALSNADSYAMFLVARQAAPALAAEGQSPPADPAPAGFADAATARDSTKALALAQEWIRAAWHKANQLHGVLAIVGVGEPAPAAFSNLAKLFPPILSAATIRGDDLLMLAGVLDRYVELRRLFQKPIAISPGAFTRLRASGSSLALTVSPVFLMMPEEEKIMSIVDRAIELLGTAQISVAMRPKYREFVKLVHGRPE